MRRMLLFPVCHLAFHETVIFWPLNYSRDRWVSSQTLVQENNSTCSEVQPERVEIYKVAFPFLLI